MNKITPIKAFSDNYIWLLTHSSNTSAVAVDPGDAQPLLTALKHYQLTLTAILITHHHYDHSGGISDLVRHYNVPVYAPATETISGATELLSEDDELNIESLDLQFKVIDIPGHTSGHIAYYGHGLLFCGDTLFAGGCGRLFEGTAEQLYTSLQKLANLPDETKAYCAHEYTLSNLRFAEAVEPSNPDLQQRIIHTQQMRDEDEPTIPSTIALEKATNPFLRCHIATVKDAAEAHSGRALKTPVEVFATLRKWKDGF